MGRGQAKNQPPDCLFTSRLSQLLLESTVDHLRLFKLHQNLPQYFRRNHVADGILDFLNYFAVFYQNHVADVFGVFYQTPRRRLYF